MSKRLASYVGIAFLYLLSILPLPLLYILSDGMVFLLYYIVKYRRRVVESNLRNSFPEKTEQEIESISRKFYKNLGEIMVETIKMLSISPKELQRRITIVNSEITDKIFSENKKLIVIQAHYTNWEWVSMVCSFFLKHKPLGVYKPLSNPYFDRMFKWMRGRFGIDMVAMKDVPRKLVTNKNELFVLGLITDQTPTKNESVYWTTFLNQPTSVFLGPEKLAKQYNCPVVYFDMVRLRRGYYRLEVVLLIDDPSKTAEYEITQAHVRYLENRIREKPEDWLWSHKRWKHQPNEEQKIKFNLG